MFLPFYEVNILALFYIIVDVLGEEENFMIFCHYCCTNFVLSSFYRLMKTKSNFSFNITIVNSNNYEK